MIQAVALFHLIIRLLWCDFLVAVAPDGTDVVKWQCPIQVHVELKRP